MSLVNVSTALKRDEIRSILEAQECPKYVFVKMKTPIEMQFDVTDDAAGSHGHKERFPFLTYIRKYGTFPRTKLNGSVQFQVK